MKAMAGAARALGASAMRVYGTRFRRVTGRRLAYEQEEDEQGGAQVPEEGWF